MTFELLSLRVLSVNARSFSPQIARYLGEIIVRSPPVVTGPVSEGDEGMLVLAVFGACCNVARTLSVTDVAQSAFLAVLF
jgi:hypothetical protein